jgi:hypothetical protein
VEEPPATIRAHVPLGAKPGSLIGVTSPTGKIITAVVPHHVKPGGTFLVLLDDDDEGSIFEQDLDGEGGDDGFGAEDDSRAPAAWHDERAGRLA